MKTGFKMVGSGLLGGVIVMAGVLAFFEWHQSASASKVNEPSVAQNQTATSTNTSPSNVVIKVIHDSPVNASLQNQVTSTVQQMLQGSLPKSFDTSGFVQYVYGKAGVKLPRTIADQSQVGNEIADPSQLTQGDLVFFNLDNSGNKASFDGIYLGNNQFAAITTHGLMAISLTDPYWRGKFLYGRRVL